MIEGVNIIGSSGGRTVASQFGGGTGVEGGSELFECCHSTPFDFLDGRRGTLAFEEAAEVTRQVCASVGSCVGGMIALVQAMVLTRVAFCAGSQMRGSFPSCC